MKLEGISLYVEKTLIIGIGDVVQDCYIGGVKGLDPVIMVPKETGDSMDYVVSGNRIESGAEKSKFQFIYTV